MRLPSPSTSGREREQRKEQKMERDAAKTGGKDDRGEVKAGWGGGGWRRYFHGEEEMSTLLPRTKNRGGGEGPERKNNFSDL